MRELPPTKAAVAPRPTCHQKTPSRSSARSVLRADALEGPPGSAARRSSSCSAPRTPGMMRSTHASGTAASARPSKWHFWYLSSKPARMA